MLKQSLQDLVGGDFNTRWQAAKVLKTFGDAVHEPLIEIAESSFHDPDLQSFIVGILGNNPSPEILLTFVDILKKSTDDELKETIVLTLGKQGVSQVDALLSLGEEPELQSAVLRALVQINHPNTIGGLLRFIEHEKPDFRALAFEALGQFHGDEITLLLRHGLKDTASGVRAICLKALGLRQSREVTETLVKEVSQFLYDINPQVCELAAKTLGRFNHPLALENLWQRLMEQPSPTPLSQTLIRALGWSSHPTGIEFLLELLTAITSEEHQNQERVQWPAELVNELIQTIATVEGGNQSERISQKLTHLLWAPATPFDQVQVKQRLIMAIARLQQPSSIPSLIDALRIEDDRIRFHVIAALKQINPEISREKLVAYNHSSDLDPKLRDGVAIALREW